MSQPGLTSLVPVAKRYALGQDPVQIDWRQVNHSSMRSDELIWMSLEDPSNEELLTILPHFVGAQTRILDEVITKHRRPKVVEYDDVTLVVALNFKMEHGVLRIGETQIVFGNGFVVSIWRHASMNDQAMRDELESKPELLKRGADYIVADLLNGITDAYSSELISLEYQVERMESLFFGGRFTHKDIEKAYRLRRTLLRIQSAIGPMSELARRFSRQPVAAYVRPTSQAYFAEVADRIARLTEMIGVLRETAAFAFEGGMMVIQLQQNDIGRKLAAWAAILAIPTAVAGIYGMNFKYMPELDLPFGYPLILGGVLVVCLILYKRFKKMEWL